MGARRSRPQSHLASAAPMMPSKAASSLRRSLVPSSNGLMRSFSGMSSWVTVAALAAASNDASPAPVSFGAGAYHSFSERIRARASHYSSSETRAETPRHPPNGAMSVATDGWVLAPWHMLFAWELHRIQHCFSMVETGKEWALSEEEGSMSRSCDIFSSVGLVLFGR